MRRPTVFVTNKSAHDFEDAKRYGDLVYLTQGSVNRFDTTNIFREISDVMKDATADDFLLVTSLTITNMLAAAIMADRFRKLNMLIYDVKTKKYVSRSISL